jgi:hypothetical protein
MCASIFSCSSLFFERIRNNVLRYGSDHLELKKKHTEAMARAFQAKIARARQYAIHFETGVVNTLNLLEI